MKSSTLRYPRAPGSLPGSNPQPLKTRPLLATLACTLKGERRDQTAVLETAVVLHYAEIQVI